MNPYFVMRPLESIDAKEVNNFRCVSQMANLTAVVPDIVIAMHELLQFSQKISNQFSNN